MTHGDNEEPMGGPPPDPSVRAWRHPSEVAAAAAAAARHEEEERRSRRRWSPLSFAIGSATGIALCLGLLGATTLTQPNDTGEADRALGGGLGQTPATQQGAFISVDPENEPTSSSTTLAAAAATQADGHVVVGSPESNGIFALEPLIGDGQIANAVAVDGLLLASATAVGERSAMRMPVSPDEMAVVRVIAIDRFTDVAVLEVIGFASTTPAATEAQDIGTPKLETLSTTPDLAIPEAGDKIALVVHGGEPEAVTTSGALVGTNQRIASADGHEIIGALTTTARIPAGFSGGVLLDGNGHAFALVVDGGGMLATAIPLSEALEVGRSLTDAGWPSDGWLGVEATHDDQAQVWLTDVEAESPAAKAGLLPGDLVAFIDDQKVVSMGDLIEPLRGAQAGDVLTIKVERDGARTTVEIVMGAKTKTS